MRKITEPPLSVAERAILVLYEFLQSTPETGPLPLPADGHWFKKIFALCERIAALESQVSEEGEIRTKLAEIESANAIWAQGYKDACTKLSENQGSTPAALRAAFVAGAEEALTGTLNIPDAGDWKETVLKMASSEAATRYPDSPASGPASDCTPVCLRCGWKLLRVRALAWIHQEYNPACRGVLFAMNSF